MTRSLRAAPGLSASGSNCLRPGRRCARPRAANARVHGHRRLDRPRGEARRRGLARSPRPARRGRLVRGLVAERSGQVMGKAGDAASSSPSTRRARRWPAPRGRCDLFGVAPLGLQLRAGIHTGECEPLEDTLVGMAVHVAARVSALASQASVAVANGARPDSGLRPDLVDRGRHDLRGISRDWQLFALRAPRPGGGRADRRRGRARRGPGTRRRLRGARGRARSAASASWPSCAGR